MTLLKRAVVVCLNLGLNEIMNQKQLQMFTPIKESFQETLGLLLEGLKQFVPARQVAQLKPNTQSLIFKLVNLVYERHFGFLISLAKKDISYFDYTLELLHEGSQSTHSLVFVSSVQTIETFYNRGFKSNNLEFKESMVQLLTLHANTPQVFKLILKAVLRSFVRGEQTNRASKV